VRKYLAAAHRFPTIAVTWQIKQSEWNPSLFSRTERLAKTLAPCTHILNAIFPTDTKNLASRDALSVFLRVETFLYQEGKDQTIKSMMEIGTPRIAGDWQQHWSAGTPRQEKQ